LISATAGTLDTLFELERAVTALLRLAVRLARKEEIASTVVQSLKILLAMKPGSIFHVSKQVSYGLHELLRNNAANIHSAEDWAVVFSLLEVVGAGASPDVATPGQGTDEDSGQGGCESEEGNKEKIPVGWVDLGKDEKKFQDSVDVERKYSIVHTRQIVMHDSISFIRSCESLSFLVRDVVHITPENFHVCVAAIRTFVEASYKGEMTTARPDLTSRHRTGRVTPKSSVKRTPKNRAPTRRVHSEPRNMDYDADEEEEEDMLGEYTHVTMQLLDLMHTLHSRAAGVHEAWAAEGGHCGEGELWDTAWCPVLQGMARLCCDRRSEIRTQALTLLQRSLLVPDLQVLQPGQWEFCFLRVLFPMLRKLLEPPTVGPGSMTVSGREETKLRAAMMLSKVFLQHLGPLSSLPTFTALWLTILDFLAQFVSTANTDLLADALPESLKNMLLVMDTSGKELFFVEETGEPTPLWTVTWEKIDTFLPNLRQETFGDLKTRAGTKDQNPPRLHSPVEQHPGADAAAAEVVSAAAIEPAHDAEQPTACIQEPNSETAQTAPDTSQTEFKVPESDNTQQDNPAEPAVVTARGEAAADVVNIADETSRIAAAAVTEISAAAAEENSVDTAGESSVFSNIANYFGGTVISAQPVSQADPTMSRDRFPSLPANLQSSFAQLPVDLGTPGPVSPADPPFLSSSAFSLPTSPSHANSLFTPIMKAPGVPATPIAAPTPLVAAPTNPVIMAPVANQSAMGILATAFSPAVPLVTPTTPLVAPAVLNNPLLAPAVPLQAFQTTVSSPNPPNTDTV